MRQLNFIGTDLRGSTRAVCDSNGRAVAWLGYDPFGIALDSQRGGDTSVVDRLTRRYTGQVFEQESGLYHYGARLYDDALARFVAADSAHQTPDPYAYCANDPVDHVDPTGRMGLTIIYFDGWFIVLSTIAIQGSSARTLPKPVAIVRATEDAMQLNDLFSFVRIGEGGYTEETRARTSLAVLQPPDHYGPTESVSFKFWTAGRVDGVLTDAWKKQYQFWFALALCEWGDALALLKSLAVQGQALASTAQDRLRLIIDRTLFHVKFEIEWSLFQRELRRAGLQTLDGAIPGPLVKSVPVAVPGAYYTITTMTAMPVESLDDYFENVLYKGQVVLKAVSNQIPDMTFYSTSQLKLLQLIESNSALVGPELKEWLTRRGRTTTPSNTTTTSATGPSTHSLPPSGHRTEPDDAPSEKTETPDYDYL